MCNNATILLQRREQFLLFTEIDPATWQHSWVKGAHIPLHIPISTPICLYHSLHISVSAALPQSSIHISMCLYPSLHIFVPSISRSLDTSLYDLPYTSNTVPPYFSSHLSPSSYILWYIRIKDIYRYYVSTPSLQVSINSSISLFHYLSNR